MNYDKLSSNVQNKSNKFHNYSQAKVLIFFVQ